MPCLQFPISSFLFPTSYFLFAISRFRDEYGLDDLPAVHGIERIMPAGEIGLQSHDQMRPGEAGRDEADDALPNRVVVAEGALEAHGLVHLRVKVSWHLIGPTADF